MISHSHIFFLCWKLLRSSLSKFQIQIHLVNLCARFQRSTRLGRWARRSSPSGKPAGPQACSWWCSQWTCCVESFLGTSPVPRTSGVSVSLSPFRARWGWGHEALFSREGNGHPLQSSCMENPTARGAWHATGHGVARAGHDLATEPPPA